MIKIDRYSEIYTDNIIDPLLSFDNTSTWTVSSGTGSAVVSNDYSFYGANSLKLQNTVPTTDLIVTNSVQNTVPTSKLGDYGFMLSLFKGSETENLNVEVNIYKNAVFLDKQNAIIEDKDKWISFVSDEYYSLADSDEIKFTFSILFDPAFTGTKTVYIDGIKMYKKADEAFAPPTYSPPIKNQILIDLKGEKGFGYYVDSLTTPTITVGTSWTQITIDGLGTNITDSLPLDIRGVSNLLTTSVITPIASGDDYDGRLDITVDSKTGSPTYLQVIIDFGNSTPDTIRAFTGYIQTAKTPPFKQSLALDFFTGNTFKTNGAKIYARTDAGSWDISDRAIKLSRKSKRFI